MNILYEGLKEKGRCMLVPSTAVESMGLGGMLGMAAMRSKSSARQTQRQLLGMGRSCESRHDSTRRGLVKTGMATRRPRFPR